MIRGPGIHLNKVHYPVTVLGPGRRLGIWLQGCSIRCEGCVSRDTWGRDEGSRVPVAGLLQELKALCAEPPEGVTISGGEPFDQPEALASLLTGLAAWREELAAPFDILCYTGYDEPVVRRNHGELLTLMDVLIAGPYVHDHPAADRLRGSANQSVIFLSELGRSRWQHVDAGPTDRRALQVVVDENSIWCVGVPGPGDMDRLRALCEARGLRFGGVSW